MKTFCILIVVVGTQILYTSVKIHQTIHLKWVNFIVCKLYFNKADLQNE